MTDQQQPRFAYSSVPWPEPRSTCPTCDGRGTIPDGLFAEMLDAPGRVRAGAPQTSRVAARTPTKGTHRHLVLVRLAYWPLGAGLTAHEIAADLQQSPNQVAARLSELRSDLFVEYVRHPESRQIVERKTTEGNTGMVQKITPAGRAALGQVGR